MQNQQIKPFDFQNYEKLRIVATDFKKSGAIPKGIENVEQLLMILQAGTDLGMSVTQSLAGLCIVNGIITPYGPTASMLMKRAGYNWSILESTAKNCKIRIFKGDKEDIVEYSMEEATWAGINHKDVWKKFPQDMLFWKCMARARKRFCPEALDGLPIYEDYEGIEEDVKEYTKEEENSILSDFEKPVEMIDKNNDGIIVDTMQTILPDNNTK